MINRLAKLVLPSLLKIREPGLDYATLVFTEESGALKAEFRADYFRRRHRQAQIALPVAVFFYCLFGMIAAYFTPTSWSTTAVIPGLANQAF